MNQVGEIWPDHAALAVEAMAARALGLIAEEDRLAARPTAAFQLRRFMRDRLCWALQFGPRKQEAMQRKWPLALVFLRFEVDRPCRCWDARFDPDLYGNRSVLLRFDCLHAAQR